MLIEACVETFDEAMLAQKRGANRIELCARLDLGGTTPDEDLVKKVMAAIQIPVKVMIRPRGGHFVYSKEEIALMEKSIAFCKQAGVAGVVFGITDPGQSLDIEITRHLSKLSAPLEVTIHKAIDETNDPVRETERLLEINEVTSILSSGKAETAYKGRATLKQMIEKAKDEIIIIAAGRVTNENLAELDELIGAKEYHGRKIVGNLVDPNML